MGYGWDGEFGADGWTVGTSVCVGFCVAMIMILEMSVWLVRPLSL